MVAEVLFVHSKASLFHNFTQKIEMTPKLPVLNVRKLMIIIN
mgnify:CR=1 FL=1